MDRTEKSRVSLDLTGIATALVKTASAGVGSFGVCASPTDGAGPGRSAGNEQVREVGMSNGVPMPKQIKRRRRTREAKSSKSNPRGSVVAGIVLWALWALACLGVVWSMEPPSPLGREASPDRFAAGRALVWVERLAGTPRVPGSVEHREACSALVAGLRDLGLETTVRVRTVAREATDHVRLAQVRNVVADLPGQGSPVLLTAHYDSVPTGPGAADDASGVAIVLEALRAAIASGRPLPRIRVLITDAEEYGLLGAKAAREDGTLPDSGIVLNFEARGGGGTVFLFETSDQNAGLVPLLNALPRPVTSSTMVSVYKRLPNDTDLSIFREAGLAGLNFAFVGRWSAYHTALDTPQRLDLRSVQHAGDAALELLMRLGEPGAVDVAADRQGGDAVWFDVLGRKVVSWPIVVSRGFAAVSILVWAMVLLAAGKAKASGQAFAWGATAAVVLVLLGIGLGWLFQMVLGGLSANRPWGDAYGMRWLEAGFAALIGSVGPGIASLLRGRFPDRSVWSGFLFPWVLATGACAIAMPGAVHVLAIPLFFATLALSTKDSLAALVFVGLLAWAVVVAPMGHGLSLLFGFKGLPMVLGAMAFFWLPLGLGWRGTRFAISGALPLGILVGGACVAAGWWMDRSPDPDRPLTSTAFRWVDSAAGVREIRGRSESSSGLGRLVPGSSMVPWLKGDFVARKEGVGTVQRLALEATNDGLLVRPRPGTTEVVVWSDADGTGIRINGVAVPLVEGKLRVRLFGAPREGWRIDLRGKLVPLGFVEMIPGQRLLEPGRIPAPVWPTPGHELIVDRWPRRRE